MIRIVTQILMGLMLFFGTVTLTPRLLFYFRAKNFRKSAYFLLLWTMSLTFSVGAFYYAFVGIME